MKGLNTDYELEYWDGHRSKPYSDSEVMLTMLGRMGCLLEGSAVDVGCGPRGGVFNVVKFDEMYGVDPLWSSYLENELDSEVSDSICKVPASAEDFELPEKVDFAFSFNALDHSGDIGASIRNILSWVKPGGRFLFHVHMRTKEQLNAGHQMLLSEDMLDQILLGKTIARREVLEECPFSGKPYRSYIAEVVV